MPRWDVTASQVEADTFWDAKGDLAVGSGADASVKLAVGCTGGHVLQICSGEASGLKWDAAPSPTGNIDNGTSNITSGGTWSVDVDSGATINSSGGGLAAAGALTFGAGADAGFYVSSDDLYIENKTSDNDLVFRVNDGGTFKEVARVVGSVAAMKFSEITDPGDPGGGNGGYLYAKADGKPYWRSNEIAEVALDGGGGGTTINNDVANRLVTVAACTAELCGEANLVFDGTDLSIATGGKIELTQAADVYITSPACSDIFDVYSGGVHGIRVCECGGAITTRLYGDVVLPTAGGDLSCATSLLNIGAAGNDWTANTLALASANNAATNQIQITNTGTGNARATLRIYTSASGTGDAAIKFDTCKIVAFHMGMDSGNTRFFIGTGACGSNDILRMNGATNTVTLDNSLGSNFDYVCAGCGRHELEPFECCGVVSWHDDVLALHDARISRTGYDHLVDIGVLHYCGPGTEREGWSGINVQPAMEFTFDGLVQTRMKLEDYHMCHEERLKALEAKLGSM